MDYGELIPSLSADKKALSKEQRELESKGAVEETQDSTGCIFKVFLVTKKDGKEKRPVINMRPLSPYIYSPRFKMEGLRVVKDLVRSGDWLARVDLKDAYLHVPIQKNFRQYLRYRHEGRIFQWKTLPFGFRDAPRIFQKLILEAVAPLREQGLRVVVYLDDILLISKSQATCASQMLKLASRLMTLGFIINLKKSSLSASQSKTFLGVVIDTAHMRLTMPQDKVSTFRSRVRDLLRKSSKKKPVTLKEVQSIVGTLQSMNDCVHAVRLHLNGLMALQNATTISPQPKIMITEQAHEDLQWWKLNLGRWNGRTLLPISVDITIDVDACDKGLGAILHGEQGLEKAHRFFSKEEKDLHINARELLAAEYGLMAFAQKHSWRNKKIKVRTDNVVAMGYINKMGGRIPDLCRLTERMHNFALPLGLTVIAEWIPGKENVEADRESRINEDYSERELSTAAFSLIQQRFGRMDLDLFATATNAKTKDFVSLKADPRATYVDAFSRPLPRGRNVYANPPFIMLAPLLAKVEREKAELVLVAPIWTRQPWWPVLKDMVVGDPLQLPSSPDLYIPSPTQQQRTPSWETIVCRVSGSA